ncbi:conserved hypothetical protein [Gammaproteobacteria bacterium]
MSTVYTAAQTTPAVSTTGTLKRTVSDKIRHLFPASSNLLALVAQGVPDGMKIKREKGLIGKKPTATPKFESFTYSPLAIAFTVSVYNSGTSLSVSSATGLRLKYTLVNTANNTVCRVGAISTNALTVTSVGSTSFSAAVGDILVCMAPAYEESSTAPYILQKDEDNLYNYVQIVRFPVAISNSAKGNPHYGGDIFGRINERNMIEGNRKVENTLIFSERASSGDTTTDGTLADAFRTTRGLWNWAQGSFPAGGAMTPDVYMKDLPVSGMHESVDSNAELIQFCGKEIFGRMQQWVNEDRMVMQQDEELKKFGLKAYKFVTSGPTIRVIVHNAFDQGEFSKKALIFNPEDVFYCYKEGRDLEVKRNIQANDADFVEHEILGEIGVGVLDGGYGITKVTEWY